MDIGADLAVYDVTVHVCLYVEGTRRGVGGGGNDGRAPVKQQTSQISKSRSHESISNLQIKRK